MKKLIKTILLLAFLSFTTKAQMTEWTSTRFANGFGPPTQTVAPFGAPGFLWHDIAAGLPGIMRWYNGTTWPALSFTLTTTGTSGAATFNAATGVLNIPQYAGGSSAPAGYSYQYVPEANVTLNVSSWAGLSVLIVNIGSTSSSVKTVTLPSYADMFGLTVMVKKRGALGSVTISGPSGNIDNGASYTLTEDNEGVVLVTGSTTTSSAYLVRSALKPSILTNFWTRIGTNQIGPAKSDDALYLSNSLSGHQLSTSSAQTGLTLSATTGMGLQVTNNSTSSATLQVRQNGTYDLANFQGTSGADRLFIKQNGDVQGAADISGSYVDRSHIDLGYFKSRILTATATLDFPSVLMNQNATLTVTVTGAAVGDAVSLGLPNSLLSGMTAYNGTFQAWVSATNTVSIRFQNSDPMTAHDLSSATFNVKVFK